VIFLDTNVLLDVLRTDVVFAQRSARAINSAARRAIGPVVYAELAAGFPNQADLDAVLSRMSVDVYPMSRVSLFLAGQAYVSYRRRGGPREQLLPDFLIGAQATIEGIAIITRDPRRYRTAFPELQVLEP